jgi:S1-C subfamily serine protease
MSRWLAGGAACACALLLGTGAPRPVAAQEEETIGSGVRIHVRGAGGLGVALEDVRAEDVSRLRLPEERGALVKRVEPDSAAAAAGLQADDVIVGYQGERVHSAAQLSRLVRETPPGRKVSIEVSRAGSPRTVSATLGEGRLGPLADKFDFDFDVPMPAIAMRPPRPPRAPAPPAPPASEWFDFRGFEDLWGGMGRGRLGVTYQELGDQLARYFKVEGGLLVTNVGEGTPAEKAGIKAGDVIVSANGKAVRTSGDLREAIDRSDDGAELAVGLQRDGKPVEVKAKLAERQDRVRRRTIRS